MKDGYLDVALGKNSFPSSFENGLRGTRAGSVKTFDFSIPSRDRPDVRAKAFVRIFKVLNPVKIRTLGELRSVNIRNHYSLPDIDRLYHDDQLLHYLVVRDIPERSLATMPLHFLAQVHNYARLHHFSDMQRLKRLVSKDKRACESIGDTMYSCGRYPDAVACFAASRVEGSDRVVIKEARALLSQGDVRKALELLQTVFRQEHY